MKVRRFERSEGYDKKGAWDEGRLKVRRFECWKVAPKDLSPEEPEGLENSSGGNAGPMKGKIALRAARKLFREGQKTHLGGRGERSFDSLRSLPELRTGQAGWLSLSDSQFPETGALEMQEESDSQVEKRHLGHAAGEIFTVARGVG